MLVVIVLMGVVGAVVTASLITTLKTQRLTDGNVAATNGARTAIEEMSRDLRTANPVRAADANSVTIDMYYGGRCERRKYYVSGTQLLMDRAQFAAGVRCGTYGATPGTATTSVVLGAVSNSASNPLFTYSRWDTVSDASVALAVPVASTSLGKIDGVTLNVLVPVSGQSNPVAVSTTVDLRNVEVK